MIIRLIAFVAMLFTLGYLVVKGIGKKDKNHHSENEFIERTGDPQAFQSMDTTSTSAPTLEDNFSSELFANSDAILLGLGAAGGFMALCCIMVMEKSKLGNALSFFSFSSQSKQHKEENQSREMLRFDAQ